MTLDQLLSLARAERRGNPLASGVIELLGEAQPCGMEMPDTFRFSNGTPGVGVGEDTMSAAEARVFAAMILRAADQAEGLEK